MTSAPLGRLDGAVGVWTEGRLLAVWHGGFTLNVYRQERDGDLTPVTCSEWMERPSREDVKEQARTLLEVDCA